jgi:hypothetical protein
MEKSHIGRGLHRKESKLANGQHFIESNLSFSIVEILKNIYPMSGHAPI